MSNQAGVLSQAFLKFDEKTTQKSSPLHSLQYRPMTKDPSTFSNY